MSMASPPHVPYQAYKSKRHGRAVSSNSNVESSTSSPPRQAQSPQLYNADAPSPPVNGKPVVSSETTFNLLPKQKEATIVPVTPIANTNGISPKPRPTSMISLPSQGFLDSAPDHSPPISPTETIVSSPIVVIEEAKSQALEPLETSTMRKSTDSVSTDTEAGPSTRSSDMHRKTSTFRYVPRRPQSSTPRMSSPLRPAVHPTVSSRHFATQQTPQMSSHHSSSSVSSGQNGVISPSLLSRAASTSPQLSATDAVQNGLKPVSLSPSPHHTRAATMSSIPTDMYIPPQRTSSLLRSPSPHLPLPAPISPKSSASSTPPPPISPSPSLTSTQTTSAAYKAVYRPGFQPKGVYRPRTDEFDGLRQKARDVGRVERTRLERRFDKLIELHFCADDPTTVKTEKVALLRRASSIFDVDINDLRSKSASDLWRTVLDNRSAGGNGAKNDIRAAEQRITPWQNDAEVLACPLCSATFHPLTNRKHHCRLCGQIICSLPVKLPQRPAPCSLLFIADTKAGRIEEVSETVDYGVKRPGAGRGKGDALEEKYMKGVRICRECKPIMLRQQYKLEARQVPAFARLYDAFISLESEIEDALPQFEELVLNLTNNLDDVPTKEATAIRKRLLESFSEYDAIAKRIQKLSCPGGPGSSQARLQTAILTRANLFLQKNMFPLQSLPKPKIREVEAEKTDSDADADSTPAIDPDSQLAHSLQPLLEQEALLESFIEEAIAHRKFEDAKTLKANLKEIRTEINRIVLNSETSTNDGGSKKKN